MVRFIQIYLKMKKSGQKNLATIESIDIKSLMKHDLSKVAKTRSTYHKCIFYAMGCDRDPQFDM